jgi:hypothetical protein
MWQRLRQWLFDRRVALALALSRLIAAELNRTLDRERARRRAT